VEQRLPLAHLLVVVVLLPFPSCNQTFPIPTLVLL
jgi:hypothetical protein